MFLTSQFLQANQDSLELRPLTAEDLDGFLALQEKALAALDPARAHHLKPRSRADLMTHLEAGMLIPGAFRGGVPVGQLVLSDPRQTHAVCHLDGYPLDDQNDDTPAIIQAVSVAPGLRGAGVAQALLTYAEILAMGRGHTRLIAKVATDNSGSLATFAKAGFSVAATGADPAKHYPVQYLAKTASCAAQHGLCWTPEPATAYNIG